MKLPPPKKSPPREPSGSANLPSRSSRGHGCIASGLPRAKRLGTRVEVVVNEGRERPWEEGLQSSKFSVSGIDSGKRGAFAYVSQDEGFPGWPTSLRLSEQVAWLPERVG